VAGMANAPSSEFAGSALPPRSLLIAVSLVSAAALSYEILLMRLFSIIQWHHFAYMMISLALLGYGASGTFLTLARPWLLPRFGIAFTANAALFGLAAPLCFAGAQAVPFNALEILWSPRQWAYLVLIYLILVPPFFFAANCIGLAFQRYRTALGRVYAADLWGAGSGALAIILLLFLLFPLTALAAVAGLGLSAAALAWLGLGQPPRALALPLFALGPVLGLALQGSGLQLQPVEYKSLAQALRVAGAEPVAERSSPLGLLSVVRSPVVPFRHAPGLSLESPAPVPEQLAVFTDGEGMTAITRWDGTRESLAFRDYMPSALPYHLLPANPKVLVLGAGGGSEVLQGIYHRAARIDAVELNPQLIDLVTRNFADFAGQMYQRSEVRLHAAEARGFVAASTENFDLIQVALLDAFNTSSAGLYGLNESYLYTVEALQAYLDHLQPGGFLAVTRWVRLPPRDEAKLFATAVEALRRSGSDPARRLAWIRGWQTSTLIVKNGDLAEGDIAALRRFADDRSFDPVWYPGIAEAETNVYNVLKEPYGFEIAQALLGPARRDFIERYKFDIRPATDDRPYFFHVFRWPILAEILNLRGAGGLSLLDLSYPVLAATLIQALALSALLILAPLKVFGSNGEPGPQAGRKARVFAYFALVGLAFMFTEMVFIQRFILYLAHPLYAVAVVLAGFLLFAGLGSRHASTLERARAGDAIVRAAQAIALIAAVYLILLPPLFEASMALPAFMKIVAVLVLIAPLAFFMGLPFPLGLAELAEDAEPLIPWAFGINGCASVVAAILATLLSIHFGQTWVLIAALVLYGMAAWVNKIGLSGRTVRESRTPVAD
jgi:spermidine synthase